MNNDDPQSASAQARAVLAEALLVEPASLSADAAIANTSAWDSLAHTRLVLGLEAALGVPLGPDDVVSLASLEDVVQLLRRLRARSD